MDEQRRRLAQALSAPQQGGVLDAIGYVPPTQNTPDRNSFTDRLGQALSVVDHWTMGIPTTVAGLVNSAIPGQPLGELSSIKNNAETARSDLARSGGADLLALPEAFMGSLGNVPANARRAAQMSGPAARQAGRAAESLIDPVYNAMPSNAVGSAGGKLPSPQMSIPDNALSPQGIRAYHGSPHDFDKFDMSRIGTGEGAQAYGHGLYFAESPAVAETYKGAGPLQQWSSLDPPDTKGKMYEVRINASPDDFLDWDKPLSAQSEKVRGALGMGGQQGIQEGGMPAEAMTRWFAEKGLPAPLGGSREELAREVAKHAFPGYITETNRRGTLTPDEVARASFRKDFERHILTGEPLNLPDEASLGLRPGTLSNAIASLGSSETKNALFQGLTPDASVNDIFRVAEGYKADRFKDPTQARTVALIDGLLGGNKREEASKALAEAGIPGIKYLDQGSRSAGEGSRNYVVFRDDIIDIVKKYGIAAAASMYGMDNVQRVMLADQLQTPEAQ